MYDLIIIGGGPAGTAAGVYASRKKLNTLLVTKEWGGQSIVSPDIQNWIGTPSISGDKLAADLKGHLEAYADDVVEIRDGQYVTDITKDGEIFKVTLENGDVVESRSVLIASGSKRRRLTVPGADEFEHKGLTYCASCDGPLFSGQDVAVIGGGNAGFETAAQLLAYAKSVTLLHHNNTFKADPVTVEKVLSDGKMRGITNAELTSIVVEIGMIPNTDFAQKLVELDEYKRVVIDPWTQQTNIPGVWAAGDCTNIKYHQNNISAGDAVRALEDIYVHLKTR